MQKLATLLFPVVPWLFLALRRAAVPTVATALIAVLFVVLEQSVEVLRSFTASAGQTAAGARQLAVWPLFWFFVTAIATGLTIWYAARLLSTVEVNRAVPDALQDTGGPSGKSPADRFRMATEWYPRILGTLALGLAMVALIRATCLLEPFAILFSVLAVAGPWAIAAAAVASSRWRWWLLGIGLVACLAAVIIAVRFDHPDRGIGSTLAAALAPALLFLLLAKRRDALRRVRSKPIAAATDTHGTGEVLPELGGILLFAVVCLAAMAIAPPAWVRAVGSASIVLAFLVAATFALTFSQLVLRACGSQVSGLSTAVLLLGGGIAYAVYEEPLGEERVQCDGKPCDVQPVQLRATPPEEVKRKFLVNAYGGGLRAAIFTAEVLAQADDASCGKFGDKVRAFSGVSGGSLGIAVYLTLRQEIGAKQLWGDACAPSPAGGKLTAAVRQVLHRDHLAPALSRMLGHDVPLIWSDPSRGQALLDSWQSALEETALGWKVVKPLGLARPLRELDGGFRQRPIIYFNAANIESGQTVAFSNEHAMPARADKSVLRVGEAILHSARFPFVTPAGLGEPTRKQRLTDGGFADNSGARTLLRSNLVCMVHGDIAINIDGNLGAEDGAPAEPKEAAVLAQAEQVAKQAAPCTYVEHVSETNLEQEAQAVQKITSRAPTPLAALLSSRVARADDAITDVKARTGKRTDVVFSLDAGAAAPSSPQPQQKCAEVKQQESAPLGWYVGTAAAKALARSAGAGVRNKLCRLDGVTCAALPAPAPACAPG